MKGGFWQYIKSAFNARPMGMFVPPNWVGIAGFGLLGILNPGFWLIGAGLELAYLLTLSTNSRFQRFVRGSQSLEQTRASQKQLQDMLRDLPAEDQRRFADLQKRCAGILDQQKHQISDTDAQTLSDGLGRLLWIQLRLLVTRQSLLRVLRDSKSVDLDPLEKRLERLQKQVRNQAINENLRKSLTGQAEILQQRIEKRQEAREKLAFLEAELARIEEQAELLREQGALSSDSAALSDRIDRVSASLGGTSQWIRDQQQIFGQVEEFLTEPPPLLRPPAKESQ